MEANFMSAGILTVIILCIVGLSKMPFEKFKQKNPKGYKATFTIISILLTLALCLFNQGVILCRTLLSVDFFVMLLATYAGVFGLYNAYEGLGAKELFKRLINAIKDIKATAPESKFKKYLDKINLDKAFEIVNAKKEEIENQTIQAEEVKVENVSIENQVINADHVEFNNSEIKNTEIDNNVQD